VEKSETLSDFKTARWLVQTRPQVAAAAVAAALSEKKPFHGTDPVTRTSEISGVFNGSQTRKLRKQVDAFLRT
jgi:hypothetical protein